MGLFDWFKSKKKGWIPPEEGGYIPEPPADRVIIEGETSPITCEHANENPNVCNCPPNCYCQTRTCKDRVDGLRADLAWEKGLGNYVAKMDEKVFFKLSDGTECCNEELALSILLKEDILFCNERHTAMRPFKTDKKGVVLGADETKPWEVSDESTTVLYVNCNDLFYWGTADAEALPNDEIGKLYRMWKADPKWGVDKWCCYRRQLRPQIPIVKDMKRDGAWDATMESLPAPAPS